jgi:hypothetical protein
MNDTELVEFGGFLLDRRWEGVVVSLPVVGSVVEVQLFPHVDWGDELQHDFV